MTTHSVCYETLHGRYSAIGSLPPKMGIHQGPVDIGWATPDVLSNPIPHPVIPMSARELIPIMSVDFRPITDNAAIISYGRAMAQEDAGMLDGSPLANGGNIILPVSAQTDGRMGPRALLSFGGAMNTALAALTGTSDDLRVWVEYAYLRETYQSLTHVIDFEEQPPNAASNGEPALLDRLRGTTESTSRFQTGANSAGPLYAEKCGYAGIAGHGEVYVRPEDLGNASPDQIPDAVTDNEASQWRAHPSVFYPAGRARYIRAMSRQYVDTAAIDAPNAGNPMAIVRVDSAPTFSEWLVGVDGSYQIIRLAHPAGSDYRRPRDIWNNVWVPILNGSKAVDSAVQSLLWIDESEGGIAFRLEYADYFRCLPLPGTKITQTGGGPA